MGWIVRGFGIVVVAIALILPGWGQDAKKDDKPATDKKPATEKKTTDRRKDAKKDKNKAKAKVAKKAAPEDKVDYGQVVTGTLKQLDANSQRDFTVTVMLPDPMKIFNLNVWKQQNLVVWQQQQLLSIAQQTNPIQRQQALAQYQLGLAQRQIDLAQREAQIYSPKDVELRAAEKVKVRTANPPTDYDDKGNLKVPTLKELTKLKKGSTLPGYPADFDALKPSQVVAVYLAKPVLPSAKSTKQGIKLEKGIKLDSDAEVVNDRPEVVMIVVVQEPLPGQR